MSVALANKVVYGSGNGGFEVLKVVMVSDDAYWFWSVLEPVVPVL